MSLKIVHAQDITYHSETYGVDIEVGSDCEIVLVPMIFLNLILMIMILKNLRVLTCKGGE